MSNLSLQDTYAPQNICFGCGSANKDGLQIKSFAADGDEVVCDFTPAAHHAAYPGVLNGGIIGTLLDCHCNWTAAVYLMKARAMQRVPVTVTAEYTIKLTRPTPHPGPVQLRARVVEGNERKAWVEGELVAAGEVCATCRGLFVAVRDDHVAQGSQHGERA